MNAHDLAKQLLAGPNYPVIVPTEDSEEMQVTDVIVQGRQIKLGWVWVP